MDILQVWIHFPLPPFIFMRTREGQAETLSQITSLDSGCFHLTIVCVAAFPGPIGGRGHSSTPYTIRPMAQAVINSSFLFATCIHSDQHNLHIS